MKSQKFYAVLLRMKGDGFAAQVKKDLFRVRFLAILFLLVLLASYFLIENPWGHVIAAFACVIIGACGAIDGGISKRMGVWPYLDQAIDWSLVEKKSLGKCDSDS